MEKFIEETFEIGDMLKKLREMDLKGYKFVVITSQTKATSEWFGSSGAGSNAETTAIFELK